MEKHDRDELDRHIEQSDDDARDLASMYAADDYTGDTLDPAIEDTQPTPPREIADELTAYVHPVIEPQQRETWLMGRVPLPDGSTYLFRVDSGAGLGHGELSLLVEHERPGADDDSAPITERIAFEYIDMTTLTETWVESVIRRAEQKRNHDALSDAQSDESER